MQNIIVVTTENTNINAFLASLFNNNTPSTLTALPARITLPPTVQPETAKELWVKHFGYNHITANTFAERCKNYPELYNTFTKNAVKSIIGISMRLSSYAVNNTWLQCACEYQKDKPGNAINHYWAK